MVWRRAFHSLMLLARRGSTLSSTLICESFFFLSPHFVHLILCDNSGKMKKPALANLCTTFGLKCTGNKSDLSNRLQDFSHQRDLWGQ
jgi:hypothetical protein